MIIFNDIYASLCFYLYIFSFRADNTCFRRTNKFQKIAQTTTKTISTLTDITMTPSQPITNELLQQLFENERQNVKKNDKNPFAVNHYQTTCDNKRAENPENDNKMYSRSSSQHSTLKDKVVPLHEKRHEKNGNSSSLNKRRRSTDKSQERYHKQRSRHRSRSRSRDHHRNTGNIRDVRKSKDRNDDRCKDNLKRRHRSRSNNNTERLKFDNVCSDSKRKKHEINDDSKKYSHPVYSDNNYRNEERATKEINKKIKTNENHLKKDEIIIYSHSTNDHATSTISKREKAVSSFRQLAVKAGVDKDLNSDLVNIENETDKNQCSSSIKKGEMVHFTDANEIKLEEKNELVAIKCEDKLKTHLSKNDEMNALCSNNKKIEKEIIEKRESSTNQLKTESTITTNDDVDKVGINDDMEIDIIELCQNNVESSYEDCSSNKLLPDNLVTDFQFSNKTDALKVSQDVDVTVNVKAGCSIAEVTIPTELIAPIKSKSIVGYENVSDTPSTAIDESHPSISNGSPIAELNTSLSKSVKKISTNTTDYQIIEEPNCDLTIYVTRKKLKKMKKQKI